MRALWGAAGKSQVAEWTDGKWRRRALPACAPGAVPGVVSALVFAEHEGVRIGIEIRQMLFRGDEWPGGRNIATSPVIWRRLFADPGPAPGLN